MAENKLFPLTERRICWRYFGLNTVTGEKSYLTQWFENDISTGYGVIKLGQHENLSLRAHFPVYVAYAAGTELVHTPGLKCPLDITATQVRKAGRAAI